MSIWVRLEWVCGTGIKQMNTKTPALATFCLLGTLGLSACSGNSESYLDALDAAELNLSGVEISGLRSVMSQAEVLQLTLSSVDNDSTINASAWQSSEVAVASVNAEGLVTAHSAGTAVITGRYAGYTATYEIEVTAAALSSIDVVVGTALDACRTIEATATGQYNDGSSRNINDLVSWSIAGADVSLTQDDDGANVFATAATSAVLTATYADLPSTTTLNITTARLASLSVTPSNASVAAENTVQLVATAGFTTTSSSLTPPAAPNASSSDSTTVSATEVISSHVDWRSANTAYASVGTSGLVTGVTAGGVLVSASCGDQTGSTTVTVTDVAEIVDLNIRVNSTTTTSSTVDYDDVEDLDLEAIATLDDGSTEDVTEDATWSIVSSDMTSSISNSSGSEGELTVSAVGDVVLLVEYADKEALVVLTID